MKNFKRVLALALAFCMLFLVACGGGSSSEDTTETKDSLVVVMNSDVGKFNPQYTMTFADIYLGYQVYEHLVHNVGGEMKGQLADKWEFSDDKMELTFFLREDATFHSGDPVTAEDVKYSLDTNIERSVSNQGKITNVEVVDEHTVKLTLAYPMESILFELATPTWGIFNKSYVEEKGEAAWEEPDGSGAYKLKAWNKGESIELEAYEGYTGEIGNIKNLTFEIIPDQSTAVIALENGSVDLIVNASAANVTLLQENENIEITSGASHTSAKVYMNVRDGVTADQNLRQAIGYAIDREAINTVAYEGRGEISTGIFSDFMYYSGIDYSYEYNPEKAKQIVDDNGLAGTVVTIKTSEGYGTDVPTIIQQNLADIGIELKIESLESSTHSQDYLDGNYELWYTANSSVLPDLADDMYKNYHTSSNATKHFTPAEGIDDAALEAIRAETDAEKKTEMLDDFVMEVKDVAGQLNLVNAPSNLVYTKGLKNVYLDPSGMIYSYQYFSW